MLEVLGYCLDVLRATIGAHIEVFQSLKPLLEHQFAQYCRITSQVKVSFIDDLEVI